MKKTIIFWHIYNKKKKRSLKFKNLIEDLTWPCG